LARKKGKADVDDLVEETLVNCQGDEGFWAFCEAFAEHGGFPQDAFVAGQPLSVREVDFDGNEYRGLVAICSAERGEVYRIGLADVVFPESARAYRYLAAYRNWLGIPELEPPGTRGRGRGGTKPPKKSSTSRSGSSSSF
jgi:hypothetical protein